MTKRMSPVVHADSRFAGIPCFLHVEAFFKDKTELDALIRALTELRDTVDDDFDHVHLQRYGQSKNSPAGDAEVIFYRPGRFADEVEAKMADDAADWIKAARAVAPLPQLNLFLEAIKAAIPHREPFLLVDEIVEQSDKRIVCRKTFRGDEWWFAGHYPEFPLTPGVLLCEAAMQAGAVLLAKYTAGSSGVPVVTRMNNVRFKRMVRPGDTVTLEVEITDQLSGAYFLAGQVKVDGTVAARLDFACKLAKSKE